MGILYARVSGAWVPILAGGAPANATWVADPAQAGPRAAPWQTMARFGHVSADQRNGFIMVSDGTCEINVATGKPFQIYDTAGTAVGRFATDVSVVNGWAMSTGYPTIGSYSGFWREGAQGVGQYVILSNVAETYLNGQSQSGLRVNNAARIWCTATGVNLGGGVGTFTEYLQTKQHIISNAPETNNSWDGAQINIQSSGWHPRIGFHSASYAPQVRAFNPEGERISIVTGDAAGFAPIGASSFITASAATVKRDVRTLRPERERIVVRHDPRSDTAPLPDIMALRPIIYRPRRDPTFLDDDNKPQPEPADAIFGIEGRRERLGLIADEVESVIPSAVDHNMYGEPLGIDYAQVTVALLDHVQRLTDEIATLRYRITELENA